MTVSDLPWTGHSTLSYIKYSCSYEGLPLEMSVPFKHLFVITFLLPLVMAIFSHLVDSASSSQSQAKLNASCLDGEVLLTLTSMVILSHGIFVSLRVQVTMREKVTVCSGAVFLSWAAQLSCSQLCVWEEKQKENEEVSFFLGLESDHLTFVDACNKSKDNSQNEMPSITSH